MTALEFRMGLKEALPFLRPSALKLTRNADDANDLLQETYLKAFSQKEKFSDGSNLRAWMYTIMKNIFINNYQRMMRRKTFIDTSGILYYLNKGNHDKYESEMYGQFTRDDLSEALESLKPELKEPFLMYFTGFKYNEIAEKLKLPLGTVKTRIHNARLELKSHLEDYKLAKVV